MTQEKSCGAVVFRRKGELIKYLILHYESGHWDFPKGNKEKGESEEQTAIREIKEETGISDIEFRNGFKDTIKYFYRRDEDVIYKEVVFYLAESRTENVELSFEHIGYVWMSFDNAFKRLTFNSSKILLEKANKYLKEDRL